jgi:hypothetical protein
MAGGPCPDPRSRRARASAARGPRPALQRAGSRLSRTAGAASAASARSARSSPAGRRERRPPVLLCDHPRAASYPCRSNGLHHLAAGGFGSAGSAPDAASGSVPSGGSARAPASETTSAPPLGTLGCSSAPASARGETSPRIPSAGTAADADIVLAVDAGLNDPGAGRRELGSPGSSSLGAELATPSEALPIPRVATSAALRGLGRLADLPTYRHAPAMGPFSPPRWVRPPPAVTHGPPSSAGGPSTAAQAEVGAAVRWAGFAFTDRR